MTTTTDFSFDLTKKVEAFTFELAKKGIITAPTMRVCAAFDISGSMDDEIRDGSLQHAQDQTGAVGIKFDDNGEIDTWVFDDRATYLGVWTPDNYKNFLLNHGISHSRGGTNYAPIINDIVEKMYVTGCGTQPQVVTKKVGGFFGFGGKKVTETIGGTGTQAGTDPVLAVIVTDGEPTDSFATISAAIKKAAAGPTFFVFLGVSNQHSKFPTLEKLSSAHDNVGVGYLKGFNLPDEKVYEQMVSDKLVTFLKKF